MSLRERIDYGLGLLVVSSLLVLVPLFDMWQDAVEGKTILSTVLENSVFVGLALLFVGLSVWLLRNDWEDQYVQLVARWSIFGTGVVALVYGWVLAFQLFVQNDLKPYVIAADGVVIGGILLFVAGVYNARSGMESAARAVERDRVAALFENTSDAVVAVAFEDGTPVITEANDSFASVFASTGESLVGRPVVAALDDTTTPVGHAGDGSAADRVQAVVGDPSAQVELRVATDTEDRDFIVSYVPVNSRAGVDDGAAGFLIFTDITPQKDRERQYERLGEGTEELLDSRSVEDVFGVVRTLAADLLDDAVVGVWEYDQATNAYRPRQPMVVAGGDRIEDLPVLPANPTPGTAPERERDGDGAVGDRVPAFDGEGLTAVLAERGCPAASTFVRRLTDQHHLVVARGSGAVSGTDRYLLDLLVANTRAVVQRVDREDRLTRRNDQLEFVNSLLRHDIQNAMTIIKARGEALADATEGREADYAQTVVDQSEDVITIVDRFRALLDALTDDEPGDLKPVALDRLIEDRVEIARTTRPDAVIRVDTVAGVHVLADEMLGNVLGNLIGNAIEHNDTDSPTVEVSVTERERVVTLAVADDGPGIPDDKKDVVFRRGNRGLKESDIGSGFGLFFVDTLVERYGGSVRVTDNEPRGAVVEVTLRKADPDRDQAAE